MPSRTAFRAFEAAHRVEAWTLARFTRAGLLVLAGLGGTAVVGIDTNRTVAYQIFSLLLALVGVAMLAGARLGGRFEVRRVLPRFATVGRPFTYRLLVENLTDRVQPGLSARDEVAGELPGYAEWARLREPDEARRNPFDRAVGYPRWAWLAAARRRARPAETRVPELPPRGTVELRPEILPLRRGYLHLTGVTLARAEPFGLYRAARTLRARGSVLVLPERHPVPRLALPGSRKYQQGGVALASSVGDSEEFAALREYRPGDPLRRIHWKSWARLGEPVVKEFQDEFFVRHALVLDTFTTEPYSRAFEAAVSTAASFAAAIQMPESLLDLVFVGPEAVVLTAGRGVASTDRLLELLACVEACTDRPFAALHALVASRTAALSGCIAVLLAWDEERQALVRALTSRGIPTLALVIGPAPAGAPAGGVRFLDPARLAEDLATL